MKYYSLILLVFVGFAVHGQSIESQISDGTSAVPYVNVGVLHTNHRTVSNINGDFNLDIQGTEASDTVVISCVGFIARHILISDLIELVESEGRVILEEALIELPEIVVSDGELTERVLGNPKTGKTIQAGFSQVGPGDQLGTIIKIKESPTFIKSFHMRLTFIDNDSMKLRLNFYTLKNGLPDKKLPFQNIFISTEDLSAGDYKLDLTDYDIVVTDDFCIMIECIENLDSVSHMGFGMSFVSGNVIGRLKEDTEWTKVGMFGLGFWVTALD